MDKTDLGETGQIDEGQVEHVWAVYPKRDGELGDALVLSSNAKRLCLDLAPDIGKVVELFVRVEKLAVFGGGLGDVDELENERPTGDDALAAGKKIATDDPENDIKIKIDRIWSRAHVSSTLDFPADWLPTWTKLSSARPSAHDLPLRSGACPARHL